MTDPAPLTPTDLTTGVSRGTDGAPAPERRPRRDGEGPRDVKPVILTVDDEGNGIAEADRPHVFERFYRADESRAMPGSGLGLAIVRQVVDRHGGQVKVDEAPGGGARFALWLPGSGAALESPDIR